jgi:hypothetical protein
MWAGVPSSKVSSMLPLRRLLVCAVLPVGAAKDWITDELVAHGHTRIPPWPMLNG